MTITLELHTGECPVSTTANTLVMVAKYVIIELQSLDRARPVPTFCVQLILDMRMPYHMAATNTLTEQMYLIRVLFVILAA